MNDLERMESDRYRRQMLDALRGVPGQTHVKIVFTVDNPEPDEDVVYWPLSWFRTREEQTTGAESRVGGAADGSDDGDPLEVDDGDDPVVIRLDQWRAERREG